MSMQTSFKIDSGNILHLYSGGKEIDVGQKPTDTVKGGSLTGIKAYQNKGFLDRLDFLWSKHILKCTTDITVGSTVITVNSKSLQAFIDRNIASIGSMTKRELEGLPVNDVLKQIVLGNVSVKLPSGIRGTAGEVSDEWETEPVKQRAPEPQRPPIHFGGPGGKKSVDVPEYPSWLEAGSGSMNSKWVKSHKADYDKIADLLKAGGKFDMTTGNQFWTLALAIGESESDRPFNIVDRDKAVRNGIDAARANMKNLPIMQHFFMIDALHQPGFVRPNMQAAVMDAFNARLQSASADEKAQVKAFIEQNMDKAPQFYAKFKV